MSEERYPQHPPHYRVYRIPRDVIELQSRHLLLTELMVTRAGYFPEAFGHAEVRESLDEYLIIYCVDGAGEFRLGDKSRAVDKGDVAFVFPDTAHAYRAAATEPWTILWAHFRGSQAAALLELIGVSPERPVITVGERLNVMAAFNEILTTLKSGYSLHYLIHASACLRHILSSIALLTTYASPTARRGLNVETSIEHMLESLTHPGSLTDFAEQANMSASHFSHEFRKKTGYAPIDYFIRLKIQKACELLDTSEAKVGEISRYLGYQDQYYFSRIFKKIIGVSPQQYRAGGQASLAGRRLPHSKQV